MLRYNVSFSINGKKYQVAGESEYFSLDKVDDNNLNDSYLEGHAYNMARMYIKEHGIEGVIHDLSFEVFRD